MEDMTRISGPTDGVLDAFGLQGQARPLPGGQGASWLVGDVVLKPGCDAQMQEWLGTDVARVSQDGFSLPDVLQARDGRWVVEGWGAITALTGVSSESGDVDWVDVVHAGRALHPALADLARPPWLSARTDLWARADAATWREANVDVIPRLQSLVMQLWPLLEPLGEDQLVHGDLTGNVLVEVGRPPAIIDISPYWRPAAYAEGIVVADAMCWHQAPRTLAADAGVSKAAVARGLLFRVLTTNAMKQESLDAMTLAHEAAAYTRTARALCL